MMHFLPRPLFPHRPFFSQVQHSQGSRNVQWSGVLTAFKTRVPSAVQRTLKRYIPQGFPSHKTDINPHCNLYTSDFGAL